MTTEEQPDVSVDVSDQSNVESQEQVQEEPKMVPLAALEAERRKRQDAEAKSQLYQGYLMKAEQEKSKEPEEDPESLLTKGSFEEQKTLTKREILEQVYQDMNPEAVQNINKYLNLILDKKPWLAGSIDSALNRYARANEIINDYKHLVEEPKSKTGALEAKKMVENANKPRSPVEIGKSARPTGTEYLKSIQGKKEFREYRQKVLQGEA